MQGSSHVLKYPPIYSFGNPEGKNIIVVGLNPSGREYINGFLSTSSNFKERRLSQLSYFDRRKYVFFNEIERFFGGTAKEAIGWKTSPWESVGYLDLVKCPTRLEGKGQWSKMPHRIREILIRNCEDYLKRQLCLYEPKILVAYGSDVGRWFSSLLKTSYEEFERRKVQLNNREVILLFVPQRQGPHSKPEISWVQEEIRNCYKR